jgi:hypothetical protein
MQPSSQGRSTWAGGAREDEGSAVGRSRWCRMPSMISGCVMTLRMRNELPHRGHCVTSTAKTRSSEKAEGLDAGWAALTRILDFGFLAPRERLIRHRAGRPWPQSAGAKKRRKPALMDGRRTGPTSRPASNPGRGDPGRGRYTGALREAPTQGHTIATVRSGSMRRAQSSSGPLAEVEEDTNIVRVEVEQSARQQRRARTTRRWTQMHVAVVFGLGHCQRSAPALGERAFECGAASPAGGSAGGSLPT